MSRQRATAGKGAIIAVAAALAAVGGGDAVGDADPVSARAKAEKCTVSGTPKRDVLRGTRNADVICGRGGRDLIRASGGNDLALGGAGPDEIYGEEGNDDLIGGPGDDILDGGSGLNSCNPTAPGAGEGDSCVGSLILERLSVSPDEVDTSRGPRKLTVTAELTETDPSSPGIDHIEAGGVNPGVGAYTGDGRLNQVSGDRAHGVFRGQLYLPKRSPRGTWSLELYAHEKFRPGQIQPEVHRFNPARLRLSGFRGFEQVGPGDKGPPVVHRVDVSPGTVDTSSAAATVEVSIHARDDEEVHVMLFRLDGPRTEPRTIPIADHRNGLVQGSVRDGVWRREITVPAGAGHGEWRLINISAHDHHGVRNYDAREIERLPGPSGFRNVGAEDLQPPRLTGFSLSPTQFDTETQGGQRLDISFSAADDIAGIESIDVVLARAGEAPWGGTFFRPGGYGYGTPTPREGSWRTEGHFPYPADPVAAPRTAPI